MMVSVLFKALGGKGHRHVAKAVTECRLGSSTLCWHCVEQNRLPTCSLEELECICVPQCTTGRVFLLKFRDSATRQFFYWLQEPKEEKDEDLLKKV